MYATVVAAAEQHHHPLVVGVWAMIKAKGDTRNGCV